MQLEKKITVVSKKVTATLALSSFLGQNTGLTKAEEEAFNILGTWSQTLNLGGTIPGNGDDVVDFTLPEEIVKLGYIPFKKIFSLEDDALAYKKAELWLSEISSRVFTIKTSAMSSATGLENKTTVVSG